TVLIENRSPDCLVHEHGLSLHLSYRGGSYLLDGGSSGRFAENAGHLGIDLAGVDAAILSHGHYDHADGLRAFLEANQTAKVYARPAVTAPDYFSAGPSKKFIGVSPALFTDYLPRFDFADGPRTIAPGLHLVPDSIAHEQSVVLETAEGLVVLNSCCHAGAGFVVEDLLARFPGQRVRAILGGFHLMGAPGVKTLGVAPGIVKNLAHWLTDELGVGQIYTGHCTGAPAFDLLKEELGDRVAYLQTGDTISFSD
ncbi:MAG: MBL fold metallo-hydrolase, partial [Pseudoflavonifractor sp.]